MRCLSLALLSPTLTEYYTRASALPPLPLLPHCRRCPIDAAAPAPSMLQPQPYPPAYNFREHVPPSCSLPYHTCWDTLAPPPFSPTSTHQKIHSCLQVAPGCLWYPAHPHLCSPHWAYPHSLPPPVALSSTYPPPLSGPITTPPQHPPNPHLPSYISNKIPTLPKKLKDSILAWEYIDLSPGATPHKQLTSTIKGSTSYLRIVVGYTSAKEETNNRLG